MENKLKNKIIISMFSLIAGFIFVSCSDWTDVESIDTKKPGIADQNSALYAEYLEDLKNYKTSKHKVVYAWFDNSVKTPFNRTQHIDNVPDSVDFVVLIYPDNLVERELSEIESLRNDKGTKVIFTVSYEAIKLHYEARLDEGAASTASDFANYLGDTLKHVFSMVDTYMYDGISVAYNGQSLQHMTEAEKAIYKSNEEAFIGSMTTWHEANKEKLITFEGKPQNLIDKTILTSCKHIIIPSTDVTNSSRLTYNIEKANVEGVPSDRFVVTAITSSLDETDKKTGYWADGSRAVTSTAVWAATQQTDAVIAGIGIYNVNNDYYNLSRVYKYTREAIDIINPSLKIK